jgi:quinol monooxygenase YgiN
MDAAQSVDDPGTFNLMQGWSNRESYDAHVASAEFQSVLHDAMRLRILDHFGALFVVLGEEEIEMPS